MVIKPINPLSRTARRHKYKFMMLEFTCWLQPSKSCSWLFFSLRQNPVNFIEVIWVIQQVEWLESQGLFKVQMLRLYSASLFCIRTRHGQVLLFHLEASIVCKAHSYSMLGAYIWKVHSGLILFVFVSILWKLSVQTKTTTQCSTTRNYGGQCTNSSIETTVEHVEFLLLVEKLWELVRS